MQYGVAEEMPVEGAPVRRITCRNPSPMTFTGTQTYLLGEGPDLAVIDPGPEDRDHLDAILRTAGQVGHILVTHTHIDHSPGATALQEATGAPIYAFGPHGAGMSETMRAMASEQIGGGEGGDRGFRPDHQLAHGDRIAGEGWALTALHTPGHLSNHLSFALGDTLFTGDTVMGWATTLVSPPEGDMAAFMATLGHLAARDDRIYLPGHGHAVEEPAAMLAHQIAHRQSRAAQVLEALAPGPATPWDLTRRIYTDVDDALLPAAARNVLATLIWQMEEGRVTVDGSVGSEALFHLV